MPRPRKSAPVDDVTPEPGTLTIESGPTNPVPPLIDDSEPEPKTTRSRSTSGGRASTASKVSADDVTTLTVAAFGMIAQLRQRPYWAVTPEECKDWAGHAAALLNKMPKSVSKKMAEGTSAGAVLIGLGGIIMARTNADAIVARQQAEQARAAQAVKFGGVGAAPASNGAHQEPINPESLFTYQPNGI